MTILGGLANASLRGWSATFYTSGMERKPGECYRHGLGADTLARGSESSVNALRRLDSSG